MLTALNECTEWGQIFILDSLANYSPRDEKEAQSICERVTPRLSHANAAVVLSAVKVLMKLMEMMASGSQFIQSLVKKLSPPLGNTAFSSLGLEKLTLIDSEVKLLKKVTSF